MASLRQQLTLAAKKAGYELVEFEAGGTDGGYFCWEIAVKRLSDGEVLTADLACGDHVLDVDLEKEGWEIEFEAGTPAETLITFKI